jgi:phosphoribosylaminoimidazole-succinocarboxamide synthase
MTSLSDWTLVYQGKVRDVYIPQGESKESASRLLMVASDRVSAFDAILSPDIPGKGKNLTAVSGWWMSQFPDIENHLRDEAVPEEVSGRAVITSALDMLPVECVVRGYLVGSGWVEYQQTHSVCGVSLPAGLGEGDQLPEPIFTPATKASVGDHDINITFSEVEDIVGHDLASRLRDVSISIYQRAAGIARERGLILADTKFEFGLDRDTGELIWADEALTPDSSRYWDAEIYLAGGPGRMASFDKQPIRDWLKAHWSREGTPPVLPTEVVTDTQARYAELAAKLMGYTP